MLFAPIRGCLRLAGCGKTLICPPLATVGAVYDRATLIARKTRGHRPRLQPQIQVFPQPAGLSANSPFGQSGLLRPVRVQSDQWAWLCVPDTRQPVHERGLLRARMQSELRLEPI